MAHRRRGTHWTYDGPAYEAFVAALRQPLPAHRSTLESDATARLGEIERQPSYSLKETHPETEGENLINGNQVPTLDIYGLTILRAPSFSRADEDPIPSSVPILPSQRIVIIEGPYTLLDVQPFSSAAQMLDEKWLLECEERVAMERVVRQYVECGSCQEEARERAKTNCMPSTWYSHANF